MLNAITLLLPFQLAGEAATRFVALPVPGPMMGMNGLPTAVLLPWLMPPLMRWLG
ncbi:MAG: hypothetical protein M0P95_10845 [Sulfuritalea sp.]|jgi:putative effector of murein hydrolase LrgA (UPF0299 family)|nr:hypothetical protein [Sulfuritalea sp.]